MIPRRRIAMKRDGLALPMVILVIALLTVSIAAGYVLLSGERRVSDDQQAQSAALNVAQAALERVLAHPSAYNFTATPLLETRTVTVPGGHALVTVRMVRGRAGETDTMYAVTSHGVYERPGMPLSPLAERTVMQVTMRRTVGLRPVAGLASMVGAHKTGAAGVIHGVDACGANPSLAGFASPSSGPLTGQTASTGGSPPILDLGADDVARATVGVNWDAVVNDDALPHTHLHPSMPADYASWPVVRVNGPASLTTVGRGILIVTGDLTIGGGFQWEGIILVGGRLTSNGGGWIRGAIITGLNSTLAGYTPGSILPDNLNGTKDYRYDSCAVSSALTQNDLLRLALRPIANAWSDSWATY